MAQLSAHCTAACWGAAGGTWHGPSIASKLQASARRALHVRPTCRPMPVSVRPAPPPRAGSGMPPSLLAFSRFPAAMVASLEVTVVATFFLQASPVLWMSRLLHQSQLCNGGQPGGDCCGHFLHPGKRCCWAVGASKPAVQQLPVAPLRPAPALLMTANKPDLHIHSPAHRCCRGSRSCAGAAWCLRCCAPPSWRCTTGQNKVVGRSSVV